MEGDNAVKIRGEHLTNLYRYKHEPDYRLMFGEAQGYSATFARRHDEILQSLLDHPERLVVVVEGPDSICTEAPCPKIGPECEAPELLAKDRRVAGEFGVEIGCDYAAGDLVALLDRIPPDKAPK